MKGVPPTIILGYLKIEVEKNKFAQSLQSPSRAPLESDDSGDAPFATPIVKDAGIMAASRLSKNSKNKLYQDCCLQKLLTTDVEKGAPQNHAIHGGFCQPWYRDL